MTYPHAALEAADDTLRPHLPAVGVLEVAPACHVETWTENGRDWGWQCFTCPTESTTTFPDLAEAERAATDHEEGR